jgi:hypothetical protein
MSFASSKDSLFSPIFRFKISRNLVFSPGTKKNEILILGMCTSWVLTIFPKGVLLMADGYCSSLGLSEIANGVLVWRRHFQRFLFITCPTLLCLKNVGRWLLASTQFSPTLYHRLGRSCSSRPTYKARGPLLPKSPNWWERDATLIKVVMAFSHRQGGTKLEWPTPHKVGALTVIP